MTRRTPLKLAFKRPWPGTLRGFILWLFGLAFIFIGGLQYIGTTLPEPTRTYLAFVLDFAPAWAIGVVFIALGGFVSTVSYCHFGRDQLGYKLAAVWCTVWGLVYVCGWLFYDASPRSVGASIIWFLFAAILTTCARIPVITFGFARR